MNIRLAVATAIIIAISAPSCWADECEAVITKLRSGIPQLEVGERTAADRSVVVNLKHSDAAEVSLTCFDADAARSPEIAIASHVTWPTSRFYDFVASAGAIIASNSEPAIRSGAVICVQRSLTADGNKADFDVNGVHFECATTTGTAQSASVRISKLATPPPSPPPPPQ